MARTQAADYDYRRQVIVEKAAELYAARGFLGASISDLSDALGTSKSLIYHYYSSKEDILFEVMDSHLRDLDDALSGIAKIRLSPAAKLRELTRRLMKLYVGAAARHKVLLNELENLQPDQRKNIVSRQNHLIRIVEEILAEIQPKLKRRKRSLTPAAMLFFGMMNWTHTWYRPNGSMAATEVADLASDIVLKGLAGID